MTTIGAGWLTGFFLYDVAETIDLPAVGRAISPTTPARMAPKPPGPAYIQYTHPPVSIDGGAVGLGALGPWQVRFKVFDYGVISIALTQPIPKTWDGLLVEGLRWDGDPELPAGAERLCRALVDRLGPALDRPRTELLSEDYLVFAATRLDGVESAEALLASAAATSRSCSAASENR